MKSMSRSSLSLALIEVYRDSDFVASGEAVRHRDHRGDRADAHDAHDPHDPYALLVRTSE
jgi:hypothetical protein